MINEYLEQFENMTEAEFKEGFIQYFGEERWKQEDQLAKLFPAILTICNDLEIEPVPVIVEDIPEDSRYYMKEDYIAISAKCVMDDLEMYKCVIHELRHKYQKHCVLTNNTKEPLTLEWAEELKSDYSNMDPSNQLCTMLEIDAYAYQKKMLKRLFNIDWHFYDELYDEVLSHYIDKYLS